MEKRSNVKNALISVFNKENLDELVHFLIKEGYNLISTGGTSSYIKNLGIPVTEVEQVTGFPEVLGGRVKTLHPHIHAGILAKRTADHLEELNEKNIIPIDLVVVNLYPFEEVRFKTKDYDELIENIDIGGPTMIRAAAKNHNYVCVITDPIDYSLLMEEMITTGEISDSFRRKMALKAFAYTSYYDSLIYTTLSKFENVETDFPDKFTIPSKKVARLRYGENPHQSAWVFHNEMDDQFRHGIIYSRQLSGKPLSYNNYIDLDSAYEMSLAFSEPFACVLKHTNPCGAAIGADIRDALVKAISGDPKSAFGGIIGVNRTVSKAAAEEIAKSFFECVIAPGYENEALELLSSKKNLRIMEWPDKQISAKEITQFDVKTISGGILIQEKDTNFELVEQWELKSGSAYPDTKELEFAWKMVKYVKSNAIVLVKEGRLVGVGAGQMSRVDAVSIAIQKANEYGIDLKNSILASDAFFPFADSIEIAAKNGIKTVIEPGGSIRDEEVIEKAEELGITLYFTGNRHFKH
ncbi:MAG: bifunctional phosphoribosylaminoimidazolecarboxamide formyltransferase/IMP cyclohydrolase [Calditrichia bacterium]